MDAKTYKNIRKSLHFRASYGPSLFIIALNITFLFSGIWLFHQDNMASYFLSLIFFAIFMNQSFLIVHECVHHTFLPRHWQNNIIGHISAVFALLPFFARKYEHLNHHLWTGNINHEPATARGMKAFSKLSGNRLMDIAWRLWIPMFSIYEHASLWRISIHGELEKPRQRTLSRLSAITTLMGLTAIVLLLGGAATLKILPAVYCYFFLIELTNLPHHLDTKLYDGDKKIPLWQQDELTESCHPVPFVTYAFTLNFNYHIEHHLFPAVPWHHLSEVHEAIRQQDARYRQLLHEFSWSYKMRRQPVKVVFRKYLEFSQKPAQAKAA